MQVRKKIPDFWKSRWTELLAVKRVVVWLGKTLVIQLERKTSSAGEGVEVFAWSPFAVWYSKHPGASAVVQVEGQFGIVLRGQKHRLLHRKSAVKTVWELTVKSKLRMLLAQIKETKTLGHFQLFWFLLCAAPLLLPGAHLLPSHSPAVSFVPGRRKNWTPVSLKHLLAPATGVGLSAEAMKTGGESWGCSAWIREGSGKTLLCPFNT